MIRYEIETDLSGAVISAPGITGVCATRGRTDKAIVVVYVDDTHQEDFEKEVEGNRHVLGYSADPDGTGKNEAKYARA